MTIERLLEITGGVLTNSSNKTEVNSATVHAKKVTEDDLFIGSNLEDIKEAIKNGASAVMFDEHASLELDEDVAHIRVNFIKDSALKLLSYIVNGDEDLFFYLVNPKTISYFKMIQLDKKDVEYLPNDWQKAFELIKLTSNMIPNAHKIMVAGGREVMFKEEQYNIFDYGANSIVIGNYLTTVGKTAQDDIRTLEDLGYNIALDCYTK
jgi:putative N-acetylmannosamine-6-phosphate epimerase